MASSNINMVLILSGVAFLHSTRIFYWVQESFLEMKFFGFLRKPQKIVPRVPQKAMWRALTSWVITFNALFISGITRVASLQRFKGLYLQKVRIHYEQLLHVGQLSYLASWLISHNAQCKSILWEGYLSVSC